MAGAPGAAVQLVAILVLSLSITSQQQPTGLAVAPAQPPAQASAAAPAACVTAPKAPECASFEYPAASSAADLNRLCTAMHFMPACSVAKACNASGAGPASPSSPGAANVSRQTRDVCQPFNLVATVCRLDSEMSRMAGCSSYGTMCVDGSRVPQCAAMPGLPMLPHSRTVNTQVRSICEEMSMDGCELCMPSWTAGRTWADCDLLDVYGRLCYAMPDMQQCAEWHAMCASDPTLLFCYGSGGSGKGGGGGGSTPRAGPVMKMYFFDELPFYLVFKSWTPRDGLGLAGACLAIFALGLVYEAVQAAYGRAEAAWWARFNSTWGSSSGSGSGAVGGNAAAAWSHSGLLKQPLHLGGDSSNADVEAIGPMASQLQQQQQQLPGHASAQPPTAVAVAAAAAGGGCCGASAGVQSQAHAPSGAPHGGGAAAPPAEPRATLACCCGGGAAALLRAKASTGMHGRRIPSAAQRELLVMDAVRGIARLLLASLAYLLMLAVMSFHVAIFFAAVAGVGVGSALFGRWRFYSGQPEGYSHCGCGS